MSIYTLNNVNMRSVYRISPGMAPDSFTALSGAWDMPARIGKCFHDWGTQGIEPYVRQDEIMHGGRDIDFYGLVRANSVNDALRQCYQLYKDIDSYSGLVPLSSNLYGTWNVRIRDEIQVDWIQKGFCSIRIPFREPIVDLSGDMPTNKPDFAPVDVGGLLLDFLGNAIQIGILNYDGYGIDGITFNNLGLFILSMEKRFNRSAPKSANFVSYETEGYQITPPAAREITITALIKQPTYAAFKSVLKGLYTLFKAPGLRYLTRRDDALRDFFIMKGFKVTQVRNYGDVFTAMIEIPMTEVNAFLDWNILTDAGGAGIQTNIGNIITA